MAAAYTDRTDKELNRQIDARIRHWLRGRGR
jgi:hypothetical protein